MGSLASLAGVETLGLWFENYCNWSVCGAWHEAMFDMIVSKLVLEGRREGGRGWGQLWRQLGSFQ